MHAERQKRLSKRLSWLLRHGAIESGLPMDPAGWVATADVLAMVGISAEILDVLVREDNKSRLQVDGDRIRACQGHSLEGAPVELAALEASWSHVTSAESVWHGTHVGVLPEIARTGLLAQRRTHVHLAEQVESRVGKRANVSVLLEVSAVRLRAHGLGLYRSPNGVLLARSVPVDCIVGMQTRSRRARSQRRTLEALFGWPQAPHPGPSSRR